MEISSVFSVWDRLSETEKEIILRTSRKQSVCSGTVIHDGGADCLGLVIVAKGQLRAYLSSEEGKEVSLYRLFDRDVCLLAASCMMKNIQFDATIVAEKDSELFIIPAPVYKKLVETSLALSNFINEVMMTRLTDIVWLIEKVIWKSMDSRLAQFLVEEAEIEDTDTLRITHEKIAAHMGTAREVVTRLLKYFQEEGIIRLSRGTIEITDKKRLSALA